MKPFTIAVDFDGTIAYHDWGQYPQFVPGALEVLQKWQDDPRIKLVLNTMRSKHHLDEAVVFLTNHGVRFTGINENPGQKKWTSSPKVYANLYIDDAALGCPLIEPGVLTPGGRAYVDWAEVDRLVNALPLFVELIHPD